MAETKINKVAAEAQLAALRAKYNSSDGTLPKNEVIDALTNKIVKQKVIRTFDFTNKLMKRYLESTPLVGGIDELINVGLGHREDFDKTKDWTKERSIPEIKAEWAPKLFEDKYYYTIEYQKFAQAMVSLEKLGSLTGQIKQGILDQKEIVWYGRMLEMLKSKNYIEIKIDEVKGENYSVTVGKEISRVSKKLTLPNSDYNQAKRINATPLAKQNLIMNLDVSVDIEWETARIFNQSTIDGLSKILYADFIDFGDKDTLATLDTTQKIYLAEKYRLNGVFGNVSMKYTNYYLHEEYNSAVLPWVDGVRFTKGKMLPPEVPTEPGETKGQDKKITELEKQLAELIKVNQTRDKENIALKTQLDAWIKENEKKMTALINEKK